MHGITKTIFAAIRELSGKSDYQNEKDGFSNASKYNTGWKIATPETLGRYASVNGVEISITVTLECDANKTEISFDPAKD